METTRDLSTAVTPNCSSCKPELLPKVRRRCKSESLDTSPVTTRPPFFNAEKIAICNATQDYMSCFQHINDINTKSPKKYFNQRMSAKADYKYDRAGPLEASEVYYNKNFTCDDNAHKIRSYKPHSASHNPPSYDPRVMCITYGKSNFGANSNYPKSNAIEKQHFVNYHPKLFQEDLPSKFGTKQKEETYRQFCSDVDTLRGKLNHLKSSDGQQRKLEGYIKRTILQANKYKETVDKSIENANCVTHDVKHVLRQNETCKFSKRKEFKDPFSNMYGQNLCPMKTNKDKPYEFQSRSRKLDYVFNVPEIKHDGSGPKASIRRRARARSESDSLSHMSADRYEPPQYDIGLIKRARDKSPKTTQANIQVSENTNTSKKEPNSKIEITCNNTLEAMTENILKDLRQEYRDKQDVLTRDSQNKGKSAKVEKMSVAVQEGEIEERKEKNLRRQKSIKRKKKIPVPAVVPDDEQECVTESSDNLGSDSEAACSDSDNNENNYVLDHPNVRASPEIGEKLTGCPFIPSLFPNVPPSIAFGDHADKVASMPLNVYRILKWKLTNITPIVVRKTLVNSGFRLLRNTNDWMGTWGKHMKSPCFRTLRSHQKINHFPGTFQIGRKDRLWRNMHKCILKFGKREFGFIPRTFVLPQDLKLLRQSWERYNQQEEKWIIKPPASARGTGIRVIQRWSQIPKRKPTVVQKYIARPLLINGSKFDLRLYVLVTSMHPLRIYLYPEGLARFASVKYNMDPSYLNDRYMHLTNYSINKLSTTYKANEDAKACDGHKWTLTSLWKYLTTQGINVQGLWRTLSDLVIRTMVSGEGTIQVLSRLNMSSRYNCYELFGVDVLLDAELKPWLLEVNISPSLHSASPLDLHVKGPLVKALFNTALYKIPPKLSETEQNKLLKDYRLEAPLCYDKRLYCTVLSRQEKEKHLEYTTVEKRSVYLFTILERLTPDDIRHLIQAEDELVHCAPLERIFPTAATHHYLQYFESPRYYNRLFDAWEHKYSRRRSEGIALLRRLCAEKVHLEVPPHATLSNGSITAPTPVGTVLPAEQENLLAKITLVPRETTPGPPNSPSQTNQSIYKQNQESGWHFYKAP